MENQSNKRYALISVTNKNGLEQLCQSLLTHNYQIYASGGTYTHIQNLNLPVNDISSYIDFPEIMSGRVKTLHPKIHGGILAKRSNPEHLQQAKIHHMMTFDLVVVNLYEFEKHAQNPNLDENSIIEHIDIGGPSMLRSAAKNFEDVCVLPFVADYRDYIEQINQYDGQTTLDFRKKMATKTFQLTHQYDQAIFNYLNKPHQDRSLIDTKQPVSLELKSVYNLRYGENPHQKAGFYKQNSDQSPSIIQQSIQGKQLSYNNILDLHAALKLIADFQDETACAIFKHNNPCGLGVSKNNSLQESYKLALSGDPISAFGGIVAFSKPLDATTTQDLIKTFTELVVAPSFSDESIAILKKKKNLRFLAYQDDDLQCIFKQDVVRSALDGYLIQDQDNLNISEVNLTCVTAKQPSKQENNALLLAWKAVKHIKSNAIVICNESQILGVGAGQTSRVDSCKIAINNTEQCAADKDLLVAASDAFFPFKDGLEFLIQNGVTSVIQPGGSIRDQEVIDAANEHGISMIFTGIRHFYH